jgi:hypothetical protein
MRRAFLLLTLLIATAVLAAPAAADVRKAPSGAAFYKPPKRLAGKHGALIWARRQTGRDALEGASKDQLLLYRSTAVDGKPIAGSGSLRCPRARRQRVAGRSSPTPMGRPAPPTSAPQPAGTTRTTS